MPCGTRTSRTARRKGKIAAIGLSNVTPAQLEEALGIAPAATVQNRLSYGQPGDLPMALACARRNVAYLKVIQQMLGHSSIMTTADTCTSVLPEAAHHAAQATADMIIDAARSVPGSRLSRKPVTHIPAAITTSGYCQM